MLNFRPNKHTELCVALCHTSMISSRGLDCTGNQAHRLRPTGPANTLAMFELLWQSQNRKAFSSFPHLCMQPQPAPE